MPSRNEINALETTRVDDPERRARLAAFMVALSENHFRPTRTIGNEEKRGAVLSEYFGRDGQQRRLVDNLNILRKLAELPDVLKAEGCL